jgi:hypothetical protein
VDSLFNQVVTFGVEKHFVESPSNSQSFQISLHCFDSLYVQVEGKYSMWTHFVVPYRIEEAQQFSPTLATILVNTSKDLWVELRPQVCSIVPTPFQVCFHK